MAINSHIWNGSCPIPACQTTCQVESTLESRPSKMSEKTCQIQHPEKMVEICPEYMRHRKPEENAVDTWQTECQTDCQNTCQTMQNICHRRCRTNMSWWRLLETIMYVVTQANKKLCIAVKSNLPTGWQPAGTQCKTYFTEQTIRMLSYVWC